MPLHAVAPSRSSRLSAHSVSPASVALAGLVGLVLLCGVAITIGLARGQDLNWDQRNYHDAIAHAFLAGGAARDGGVGGAPGFLNPLPYLPWYWAVHTLPPRTATVLICAFDGLVFWLAAVLAWLVSRDVPYRLRLLVAAAATVLSVASPMALTEIGTSYADLPLAVLVLAGLALLLSARAGVGRVALGALLLGAAVGFKATNATLAVGYAVAALVGWPSWAARVRALVATAIAGVIGTAAAGGFWYAAMWRAYGNPLFPYFNAAFRSPDYPARNLSDANYLPRSLVDAASYPLRWAIGSHPSSELPFVDTRFAIVFALVALAVLLAIVRRGGTGPRLAGDATVARVRLALFALVAFVLWLGLFSIQRYLVPVELLMGPLFLALLVSSVWGGFGRWVLMLSAAIAVATVRVSDWGHVPWGPSWYAVRPPAALEQAGVVFLGRAPDGFLAAELPGAARFFQPDDAIDMTQAAGTVFARRIRAALSDAKPAALVTREPPSGPMRAFLGQYGLTLTGRCDPLPTRWEVFSACGLERGGGGGLATAPLTPGRTYRFGAGGDGFALLASGWGKAFGWSSTAEYGLLGWTAPELWGVWAHGDEAAVTFALDGGPPATPVAARLTAIGFVGPARPSQTIFVRAGDAEVARWTITASANLDTRLVCLPPSAFDAAGRIVLRFEDPAPRSPAQLGTGEDTRPWTVGLLDLRVDPQPTGACP